MRRGFALIPDRKRPDVTYLDLCREVTMRLIRWCALVAVVGLLPLARSATVPAQEKAADVKVTFEVAKYDRLGEVVRQQKGKVVVVSFWSTT
jgi:hypothetical protein